MVDQENARRALDALITKYKTISAAERKEISEAGVVRQFLDVFLEKVLGYPIGDPQLYKYELHTAAGRPDITLTMPNGEKLYIEAKRFGVIKPLDINRNSVQRVYGPAQLELPGMAN